MEFLIVKYIFKIIFFILVNHPWITKIIDIDDKKNKYGKDFINFVIAYFLNGFIDLIRIPIVVWLLKKIYKK